MCCIFYCISCIVFLFFRKVLRFRIRQDLLFERWMAWKILGTYIICFYINFIKKMYIFFMKILYNILYFFNFFSCTYDKTICKISPNTPLCSNVYWAASQIARSRQGLPGYPCLKITLSYYVIRVFLLKRWLKSDETWSETFKTFKK